MDEKRTALTTESTNTVASANQASTTGTQSNTQNTNTNLMAQNAVYGSQSTMPSYGMSSMYSSGMGSSMYGGSYGGGFGGYGSSMYGSMNTGMYNQGMMGQNGQTQDPNERRFRDEYQGLLMGFNSLLNIMGAGLGLVGYGGTFFHYTKNAVMWVLRGCSNLMYRVLCIEVLKKFFNINHAASLEKAFTSQFQGFAQKITTSRGAASLIQKCFQGVRIIAALALVAAIFCRKNYQNRFMRMLEDEERNAQNFNQLNNPLEENANEDGLQSNFTLNLTEREQQEEEFKEEAFISEIDNEADVPSIEIAAAIESQVEVAAEEEAQEVSAGMSNAFSSVIENEKQIVQNTQVRSEEFWKRPEQPSRQEKQESATVAITDVTESNSSAQEQQTQIDPLQLIMSISEQQSLQQEISRNEGSTLNWASPPIPVPIPSAGLVNSIDNSLNLSSEQSDPTIQATPNVNFPPPLFKAISNRSKPWLK